MGYILGWDVAQVADHGVYSGVFPSETASMQTGLHLASIHRYQ